MKNGILKFAIMLAVMAIGFAASAESAWAAGASICPDNTRLYVYTGVGFSSTEGDTDLVSGLSGVNGYVCLYQCIGTFAIFPAAFSFSDGMHTITDQNWVSYAYSPPFGFTCDANGSITQWWTNLHAYPNSPLSTDLAIEMGTDNWGPTVMDWAVVSWANNCPGIGGGCSGGAYARGSTGWWSSASNCSAVLQNSVRWTTKGSTITATFTPNGGSIALAANLCGVSYFNWQQFMTYLSNPNTWLALGPKPEHILTAPPKISDPPPAGLVDPAPHSIVCRGVRWNVAALDPPDGSYPFYYNLAEIAKYSTASKLWFYDNPNDACFSGAGPTENPGAHIEFSTTLVGVDSYGNVVNLPVVNKFTWLSTYNGTAGGAYLHKNLNPPDPGTGTGGVTVLSVNGVSTLGTCAADVTANVNVALGGYVYSMGTGRFSQKVTLTNTSGAVITGPLSLVLDSLPGGVSLYNGTGATACAAPIGSPFVNFNGDLAAGASESVTLQLPDPTMTAITYTPRVLAGTATR
ncbi:MAG: hypothetical protein ABSC05_06645 [Candidatus Solibacter sp.]|jgi:hypothetical protein